MSRVQVQTMGSFAKPSWTHESTSATIAAAMIRYRGKLDAVAAMMDHGVNPRHRHLLAAAVSRGYLELAQYLLAHGITSENDRSADNRKQEPELHMAVSDGDLRMAQLLLKYGERVDVKNGQGLTTVQVAEEMQHLRMIELLE